MNRGIKAKLKNLPYREMVDLCRQIQASISEYNIDSLADILSSLADEEDTESAMREKEIIRKCFTRKKSFSVQPHENGFKILCPSLDTTVYTDDIRDGLSQMLDNIVAIKVLS